jgi:hypothetical protein
MTRALFSTVALLLVVSAAEGASDITTCGQTVPSHQRGVLQADLDCPQPMAAVQLEQASSLLLNGHRITTGWVGIFCNGPGPHIVKGPGEITAPVGVVNQFAIEAAGGTVSVRDLVVHDNSTAIFGDGKVSLRDVTIRDNWIAGTAQDGLDARGVTIENNQHGFLVEGRLLLKDVVVKANGSGFKVIDGGVLATHAEIIDNGDIGIESDAGLLQHRLVRLVDSTITGNDPGEGGIDIRSSTRPMLRNTVCGRSEPWAPPGITWGVCADD